MLRPCPNQIRLTFAAALVLSLAGCQFVDATVRSGATPTAGVAAAKPIEQTKPVAAASPTTTTATATATATPVPTARVKIVSSLPRSGGAKGQTDSMVNAIRMALEAVGSRVGTVAVDYEDLDSGGDGGKEAENANKAAADPDVVAYLGPFSSAAARVAIPILNRAGVVTLSPSATAAGLTRTSEGGEPSEPEVYYPAGTRTFARVIPADDVQGVVGAHWANFIGGGKKVYLLDDASIYGRGISTAFARTAETIGVEVVGGPEVVDPRAGSYDGLAKKVRGATPDFVYYAAYTESKAARLFGDLRSTLAPKVRFMGPDSLYIRSFAAQVGDAGEGMYVSFSAVLPPKLAGKGADWYAAYKAKYNAEPEPYAAYSFEATTVLLDAIKRAGADVKDRGKIREAVFATKAFDGVLGTWSFDKNGDTTLTAMSGLQIKGGGFDVQGAVVLEAPGGR